MLAALAGSDLQSQSAAAADGFVILVRRDHQHRFAEGRADGDGPNGTREIIGEGSQLLPAQIQIAERRCQEKLELAAGIEQRQLRSDRHGGYSYGSCGRSLTTRARLPAQLNAGIACR